MNNIECPLYKKGLYVEKINSAEAYVSMCCMQICSPVTYSKLDFNNNNYLEKIRNTDAKISACASCINNEKIANQSYRQGQILAFEQQGIPVDKKIQLKSLSWNCENVCNLKCVTCGPKFSSQWIDDYKKLNWNAKQTKTSGKQNRLFDDLDVSNVELLHFQGGEPLLSRDHEMILEKIESQGDLSKVIVSYNTNATVFPNSNTIRLWNKTKMVKLFFSIDATEQAFEYIRFPANWLQVTENMKNITNSNLSGLWIELGVTIGINNIFYLQDIIDWKNQHFNSLPNGNPVLIFTNFVTAGPGIGGDQLQLENMDFELQTKILQYLSKLSDNTMSQALISKVKSIQPKNTRTWIEYLDSLDQIRHTNWKHSLSQLYQNIN